MRSLSFSFFSIVALMLAAVPVERAHAQQSTISGSAPASGTNHGMREDDDGNLEQGEYEVISPNGSVTRALCPYTCEMRGLPKQQCITWKSASEPTKCYVQDRSIPSQAVPFQGAQSKK
ncbi:MAG: hypothetical protein U0136_19900 [Bdellovibrionota bacterium]